MIQLLELAQPDGQYAAAAALYNLAGQEVEVRLTIVACKAVPALVRMLQAHSWSVPLHLLHLVAASRLFLSMLFGSYLTGHMAFGCVHEVPIPLLWPLLQWPAEPTAWHCLFNSCHRLD